MQVTIFPPKKASYEFKPTKRATASIKREIGEHCGSLFGGAAAILVLDNGEIWEKSAMNAWRKGK